jgi:hypothetical protein
VKPVTLAFHPNASKAANGDIVSKVRITVHEFDGKSNI